MADDLKRTECLKLWLTEREFTDLARLALHEDRKQGELARVIIRRALYGHIGSALPEDQRANSPASAAASER